MEPKIYGVLGYPVRHSFSPAMHNAAFSQFHLQAEYRYFEKQPQELAPFLSSLSRLGIFGLNVTIPYKERVIPFLAEVSPEARLIGSVNTIKVSASALSGFNTDGAGFLRHLEEDLKFNPAGKTVALLGAGGAARAVAVYLAKAKAGKVSLFDIDTAKAEAFTVHLKGNFKDTLFSRAGSLKDMDIAGSDILINATPVGMKEGEPCLVKGDWLHQDLLVYDLIYNPKETALLNLAREKGAKTANGLGMLLYQGAASFQIWTGREAPIEVMRRALTEVAYR